MKERVPFYPNITHSREATGIKQDQVKLETIVRKKFGDLWYVLRVTELFQPDAKYQDGQIPCIQKVQLLQRIHEHAYQYMVGGAMSPVKVVDSEGNEAGWQLDPIQVSEDVRLKNQREYEALHWHCMAEQQQDKAGKS